LTIISRKNFLKISLLGLIGAGFSPGFQTKQTRRIQGLIGRIAADDKIIPVYQEPSYDSEVVRETVFDELLHLYFEQEIIPEESSPQLWYRVWGGYLPGAYVQQTRYRLNQPVSSIPECGRLAEITVPYTEAGLIKDLTGKIGTNSPLSFTVPWSTTSAENISVPFRMLNIYPPASRFPRNKSRSRSL